MMLEHFDVEYTGQSQNFNSIADISVAHYQLQKGVVHRCTARIKHRDKVVGYMISGVIYSPVIVKSLLEEGYAIPPLALTTDSRIYVNKDNYSIQSQTQTKKKLKALPCDIYKHCGTDSSNKGLSSRFDEILLLCPDGSIDVDMDNPPENLCRIKNRHLYGSTSHLCVEPVQKPEGVGWMYGGTLIHSSDARFYRLSNGHPLQFHDRQESQELYDRLSR